MNFIEFINDQQQRLISHNYVNALWCALRDDTPLACISPADEEAYRSHIPLEFPKFLKKCNLKLRDLKVCSEKVDWQLLDEKYTNTLIHFALEQEDVNIDGILYAANLFFLINIVGQPRMRFFHKLTYLKVLQILNEFAKSQELTSSNISFLIDDFKAFLMHASLPSDVVTSTISVIHDYTYYCNEAFENITTDASYENLGYLAFTSLKILTEQLLQQRDNEEKLYAILLCLTSSLKSKATSNLSRTVKIAHQKNVCLFIQQNFDKFCVGAKCLVSNMLKFVCLCSDYDEYEAIAILIQQLPCEANQDLIIFLQNNMHCQKLEFRKRLLSLVMPVLQHPPAYETNIKRLIRTEIFVHNILMLLVDSNEQIREDSLKITAEMSEDQLGQRILKKMLANNTYSEVNKDSIANVLYKILDKSWHKKALNVMNIQLMCNLLIIRKDLVSLRTLNRLRDICLGASPNDLKPCILHLKRLLRRYTKKSNVVMYVLSIFIKQMFHPMATSVFYAKALYEFIFSNITLNNDNDFVWNVLSCLISNHFDVTAIFEKFYALNLLGEHQVKVLMEHKIYDSKFCTTALKLLGVMLQFVPYSEYRCLHERLEQSINNTDTTTSETDQYLIIYALTRILEKINPKNCSIEEINDFRRMQILISETFYNQMFPSVCVNYVTSLLTVYENLVEEDCGWNVAACSYFEEDFGDKLMAVCNRSLKHHSYLTRDVSYISELIMLSQTTLSQANFDKLKKIVTVAKQTPTFTEYLENHEEIWSACILLYSKICFINPTLIPDCISNLEMIMHVASEYLQLQILYILLDFCNKHLQYYDPLVPLLFKTLHSKNAYSRFISSKIIMQLISSEQLRLMDGQYYLFMKLLVDEKDIISTNVKVFVKEKFSLTYYQTIARHFVPSIIHYNHYYDHPTFILSQEDQDVLKQQLCSSSSPSSINCFLYNCLSDELKYNILNQICNEVLMKILNKTLPRSEKIFMILEEVLIVVLNIVPKDIICNITDDREYYSTGIERIKTDLVVSNLKNMDDSLPAMKRAVLKNLLTSLLQLLYTDIAQNAKNCQNLLFTIIVLTNTFYPFVKYIINEESTLLKGLYKALQAFYNNGKDYFAFCLLTVNPYSLPAVSEKDVEFYIKDYVHLSYIPPSWCDVNNI